MESATTGPPHNLLTVCLTAGFFLIAFLSLLMTFRITPDADRYCRDFIIALVAILVVAVALLIASSTVHLSNPGLLAGVMLWGIISISLAIFVFLDTGARKVIKSRISALEFVIAANGARGDGDKNEDIQRLEYLRWLEKGHMFGIARIGFVVKERLGRKEQVVQPETEKEVDQGSCYKEKLGV